MWKQALEGGPGRGEGEGTPVCSHEAGWGPQRPVPCDQVCCHLALLPGSFLFWKLPSYPPSWFSFLVPRPAFLSASEAQGMKSVSWGPLALTGPPGRSEPSAQR